ncbi:hypothetical protein B0H65DRAFT_524928 [Neurospora tetraspora]|uniref:Uncharacterized protein n=1 Tax=Neurospora tetraspora TaxID=94610 RepID=A0AAE0MT30_9PEZI|nr:hypothetical protein B0H65DRAFT_524928 [Neurospora tetraspora]
MPHFLPSQLLVLIISLLCSVVLANVEKTIFLGPSSSSHSEENIIKDDQQAQRWLDNKLHHIHTLTPTPNDRSSLRTRLKRVFPSADHPRGQDAWFLLDGLTEGQRYEVRVCWAATQPTNFYMETYTAKEVIMTPHLAGSLMEYFPAVSPQAQHATTKLKDSSSGSSSPPSSSAALLLHISAAADYFTSNASLMLHPPPVDVDIILDPFLFNVLPRSLVPTIGWIVVVAVAGWAVSKRVVSFLVGEVVSSEVEAEEEASEGVEESKKER